MIAQLELAATGLEHDSVEIVGRPDAPVIVVLGGTCVPLTATI